MSKTIGEAQYKDIKNKNLKIEKIAYDETEQRHFINESLYFCNVSKEAWEYKISDYAVLDKYLKSHKS